MRGREISGGGVSTWFRLIDRFGTLADFSHLSNGVLMC